MDAPRNGHPLPRLLAPLRAADEVDALVEAGADALYAGYLSESFRRRFGSYFGPNARHDGASNFVDAEALAEAGRRCDGAGVSLSVVYNRPLGPRGLDLAVDEIGALHRAGIRRITVSRPELLSALRTAHPDLELGVSVLAGICNDEALALFAAWGARRVTLPPQLPLSWITSIARAAEGSNCEISCFVLGALCPFLPALCGFAHGSRPGRLGPLMGVNRLVEEGLAGRGRAPLRGRLHGAFEDLRSALMPATGPACTGRFIRVDGARRRLRGHPRDSARACAACSLPLLLALPAVTEWKIAGRDHVLGARLRNVAFMARMREAVAEGLDGDALRRLARRSHREILGRDCSPSLCFPGREEP